MGNQQMAYSSNQPQPPSVEDQNEWYDSVSDVEEHKQQINTPETNVVVNGILDEFIDSLFESKLANSPNEALTGQNLPEDQQHNVNQSKDITYEEGAPNWKGVDFPPESGCPARLLPNNFQVPPSTSDRTVRENDYSPKESEIKSLANIRGIVQETINEPSISEDKLCKENGPLFAQQQTTNENMNSLKELCVTSDSVIPLPCPEDCEVFRESTVNESIKAFELTPKDVQRISQSGKFCEVFCDPKEIDSFQETLEAVDKYADDNRDRDEDVPLDSESIEALSTSTIIRAGEEILEKTASYLEQIASNRNHKEENTMEKSITSTDSCDPFDLSEHVRNECLDTKQSTTLTFNEIIEHCDEQEDKLFKPNVSEDFETQLPEELAFPSVNLSSCQETPQEDVTYSNKSLDEISPLLSMELEHPQNKNISLEKQEDIPLLSADNSEHLQNMKIPEEIQKPITVKESVCDVLTTKQDDAAFTSDFSIISKAGGLDDISYYNTNNVSLTSDVRQDDTISKGIQQEEPNTKELPLVSEDLALATNPYSMETHDPVVKGEEEKSVSRLGSSVNDNATIISSAIPVDAHSSSVEEESFQNCTSVLSKSSVSVLSDLSEAAKLAKMTYCDSANDIPSKSELSTASVPLLVEVPPYNSENNSPALPKDPVELPKLLDAEKSLQKQAECLHQYKETRTKSIEISDSVSEILTASTPSSSNEIPSNSMEKDEINDAASSPLVSTIDTLWAETESSAGETYTVVKECGNSNTPTDEIINSSSPLLGVDERLKSHNNDSASIIPPKDEEKVITSFEEIAKIKYSGKDELRRKHFEGKACDNSNTPIGELTHSSPPLLRVDERPISHNNESTSVIPPKDAGTNVTSLEEIAKFKSFKKDVSKQKHTEVKACDNAITSAGEIPSSCTSFRVDNDSTSAIPAKDVDTFITSFEEIAKCKSFGKDTSKQKNIEIKACGNSNNPACEIPSSSAPLLGANEKPLPHNNNSTSAISSKDEDAFITGEITKFKSFETDAQSSFQNEGEDRKFSEVCSEKEVSSSVTENVSNPAPVNPNDVAPSNVRKETQKNTKGMPRKSSIGVLSVKRKSFSSEAEKHIETKQNDKSNLTASKDEAPHAPPCLPEKENRPPPQCSSAVPPVVADTICTPIEGRRKSQSSGKEQAENRQHKESRRKSSDICSHLERIEDSSKESVKETASSIDEAISPEINQYRNLYEEGNICNLDDVLNQFRQKHNPDSVDPYSNVDKRKDLLDKLNTKRTTSDVRRNSAKNMERSNLQAASTYKKETKLPDIKNKSAEDIPVCLDRQEFKTPTTSSQNDTREQNSGNVLPTEDPVNFRGIIAGDVPEQQSGSKKKYTDAVKERGATNDSNTNVDNKKVRMPELKPETLKSLIADLSLNKSTIDVGCNTTEDWTKKDNSKAEAEWLKERKKLIGRITDLHQTQNATKFIVKELIYLVTSWMEGKDKDNVDLQETRQKIINERDQALEDLRSVEESFYELHRRYEKTKKLIEDYKKNEDILKQQIADGEEKLQQQKQMFDHLVKHSEDKLEQANSEILNLGKSKESEMAVLTAQLRKAEMKANSLEKALEQKVRENTELSSICEDLITKCGRK